MIKKITDSEQIAFWNKIFQRYLNVFFSGLQSFDLGSQPRSYPSRDHCIVSYTGGRSRTPYVFNVGFTGFFFFLSALPP